MSCIVKKKKKKVISSNQAEIVNVFFRIPKENATMQSALDEICCEVASLSLFSCKLQYNQL